MLFGRPPTVSPVICAPRHRATLPAERIPCAGWDIDKTSDDGAHWGRRANRHRPSTSQILGSAVRLAVSPQEEIVKVFFNRAKSVVFGGDPHGTEAKLSFNIYKKAISPAVFHTCTSAVCDFAFPCTLSRGLPGRQTATNEGHESQGYPQRLRNKVLRALEQGFTRAASPDSTRPTSF